MATKNAIKQPIAPATNEILTILPMKNLTKLNLLFDRPNRALPDDLDNFPMARFDLKITLKLLTSLLTIILNHKRT